MAAVVQQFVTLPSSITDTLDYSAGQSRIVIDNQGAGDQVSFAQDGSHIQCFVSSNNGATQTAITSLSIAAGQLQSIVQDANGLLHGISSNPSTHVWYYTRFAFTRSSGHVTALTVDQASLALPNHSPDSVSDPRGAIIIAMRNGSPCPFWEYQFVIGSTFYCYVGYITGITGTTTSVGIGGSGNDTNVFGLTENGYFSNHTQQILLAQERTSETIYVLGGCMCSDYSIGGASSDSQYDVYYYPLTKSGSYWSLGTRTVIDTTTGGGTTYEPFLLSARSSAGSAYVMYYRHDGQITFGRFDSSGTYHDNIITSPYTVVNRGVMGVFNTDGTNFWMAEMDAGVSGASPAGSYNFWNGTTWATVAMTSPGLEESLYGVEDCTTACWVMNGVGSALAQTRTGNKVGNITTAYADQFHQRVFNDDGNEAAMTAYAAQDTNFTAPLNTNFILRSAIQAINALGAQNFAWEYDKNGSGTFANVPVGSTTTYGLPTIVSSVTSLTTGTGAVTWPLPPTFAAGDILVWCAESANEAVPTAPTGSTAEAQSPQGTGTAASTTATRLSVYWKVATGSETTNSAGDAGDHTSVMSFAVRGAHQTTPIHKDAGSTGTSGTSITFDAVTTTVNNCLIVNLLANSTDTTTSQASAQANGLLGSVTKVFDKNSSSGNGGGITVISGTLAASGTSGATTLTLATASITGRITLAFQPPAATANELYVSTSSNITAGGVATTNRLTAGTGSFSAGVLRGDANGADAVTIPANGFTEMGICLQAQSPAVATNVYRIRIKGLDTYDELIQWTIGTSTGAALATAAYALAQETGALSTTISIAGAAKALAAVTASLNMAAVLAASSAAKASMTDALTAGVALQILAPVSAFVTAALTNGIPLSTANYAVASATAALTTGTANNISASSYAKATNTVAISTGVVLGNGSYAQSIETSNISSGIKLAAVSYANAQATAGLAIGINAIGYANAQSTASLTTSVNMNSAQSAVATNAVAISAGIPLSANTIATATAQALLTSVISASMVSVAQVSSTVTASLTAQAALQSTAYVTAIESAVLTLASAVLADTSYAASAVSASLTTHTACMSIALVSATLNAQLNTAIPLQASQYSIAQTAAALTTGTPSSLSVNSQCTMQEAATLTTHIAIASQQNAMATQAAALSASVQLVTHAQAAAQNTALLTTLAKQFAVQAQAITTLTGALTTSIELVSTVFMNSSMIAALYTVNPGTFGATPGMTVTPLPEDGVVIELPIKFAAESYVLALDMSVLLPEDVLLTGAPSVIITQSQYAAGGMVLNGTPIVDATGTLVLVPLAGGAGGTDYIVTVSCATTSGSIIPAMQLVIPVV